MANNGRFCARIKLSILTRHRGFTSHVNSNAIYNLFNKGGQGLKEKKYNLLQSFILYVVAVYSTNIMNISEYLVSILIQHPFILENLLTILILFTFALIEYYLEKSKRL